MGNILRMDLYRILHGKSFWIFLAVVAALGVIGAGTLAVITDPAFMESVKVMSTSGAPAGIHIGLSDPDALDASDLAEANAAFAMLEQGMSPEALVGSVFLGGGGITSLFAVFIAIFLASEFESGFNKNVFTAQPNRLWFLGVRIAEIVLLAAVFVVVAAASTLGTAAVAGLELTATSPTDLLLWGALVVLAVAGFGMLTALAVWLTRKMGAGIAIGIVLAAGMVTALLQAALLLFPSASYLADFTLSSCTASLAHGLDGGLGVVHIAMVSMAFIVLAAVLSGIALQKKDM